MTKRKFYLIVFCFFVAFCNAQEATQNTFDIDIKEDLKNYLLVQYDNIKISEIYTKNDNKKDYLKKSLGNALLKEASDVRGQDIYFKEASESIETHFGIAYFFYATPIKAKTAIANIEKEGFFENTKILTKYVAVNAGTVNLVFFTESSANKVVLDYLDSISNKALNMTHKK